MDREGLKALLSPRRLASLIYLAGSLTRLFFARTKAERTLGRTTVTVKPRQAGSALKMLTIHRFCGESLC